MAGKRRPVTNYADVDTIFNCLLDQGISIELKFSKAAGQV